MNPRYPVYIPSKGRWDSRLTVKALEALGVPYWIVIEQQEYDQYAAVIDPAKILVLPFSNEGLIASRCWIMQHSINAGYARHWQLDDNIRGFYRLHQNMKYKMADGTCFRVVEDLSDKYVNVAYSGLQYELLAPRRQKIPPFILNTRIYSCTLVNNAIPYRWRSVYNDDTDVCLRALKDGWCTLLVQAFLADKAATMTIKGGNTDDLYLIKNGRLKMSRALEALHPDVTKTKWKWGRWQHYVDYTPFKSNKLIKKAGITASGVNNYGMVLKGPDE